MQSTNLKIAGYSTALFSTWFFIEAYGLLFDAGDGLTSTLLQKCGKIKHAYISHADRDHLGGLFQFYQLNARKGFPVIYYPADSGSFPAMQGFLSKFDPHVKGSIWTAIRPQEEFKIKDKLYVQAIRNNHVDAPQDLSKSLSYLVLSRKSKLKEAFRQLSGQEIKTLVDTHGKDYISDSIEEKVLGYSGDTPVDNYAHWENTKVLIHEATFLDANVPPNKHANKHSHLNEVLKMAAEVNIEQLILSHFSSRYDAAMIDAAIRKGCREYGLQIPVYRLLPGEVSRDILAGAPVNG